MSDDDGHERETRDLWVQYLKEGPGPDAKAGLAEHYLDWDLYVACRTLAAMIFTQGGALACPCQVEPLAENLYDVFYKCKDHLDRTDIFIIPPEAPS